MKHRSSAQLLSAVLAAALSTTLLSGCGSDSDNNTNNNANTTTPPENDNRSSFVIDDLTVPTTYTFPSLYLSDTSSVSYTGQTMRHLLIADMITEIKRLSDRNDLNTDEIEALLNFYFNFDSSANGAVHHQFTLEGESVTPGPTYGDVSSNKNLSEKVAGEDPIQLPADAFFGWDLGAQDAKPIDLVNHFIEQIAQLASNRNASIALDNGTTADIDLPYVSELGQDYRQLIQKFLLGAIAYSQGTADYLKTDFSQNNANAPDDTRAFSTAQHKWDEAFGYFGAARDYSEYSDDEIAGKGGRPEYSNGYYDSNGDGLIDLHAEINQGHAVNCAKRDRGTADLTQPTDFTQTAFTAFLNGRAILNSTTEELSEEALAALQAEALTASQTWEKCIAATVIHYINDTVADMDDFGEAGYNDLSAFKNHAKHWSEMKGFALGLQFNPDSPFLADSTALNALKTVLSLMGDAPVLPNGTQNGSSFEGGVAQYRADLIAARDILESTYNFDSEHVSQW